MTTTTTRYTHMNSLSVSDTYCTNDLTGNFKRYAAGQRTEAECESLCRVKKDTRTYLSGIFVELNINIYLGFHALILKERGYITSALSLTLVPLGSIV